MLNQDVAGGSSISREYAFSLNGSTLAPGERLLEIADIDLRFGGIQALDGVGLTVARGEIHSIIGPNGAGKSSLINCVSGLYRPQQGRITLHRRGGSAELVGRKPHEIARAHSATIRARGARATLPLNPPTRSTT